MVLLRWLGACALLAPLGCTAPIIAELLGGDSEPKTYAQHGIGFSHPGNWDVETEIESEDGFDFITVSLDGPESVYVMVQQVRPAVAFDADELMTTMSTEIRTTTEQQMGGIIDYDQGKRKAITRSILGSERAGVESQSVVALLGQKVPHTAQLFPIELADRSIIVFVQVADEDRAQYAAGFDAILDSLAVQ